MDRDVQTWRQNKPLRFGRNLDADVQQFLAQGVRIMDGFNEEMPLGLSDSHRQVRNRCNELARGMEKVLARRPDEERPVDSWKYVKIRVTPAVVKEPGQTAWSVEKTREAVRNGLRGHFQGSPWKAGNRAAGLMPAGRKTPRRRRKKPTCIRRCPRRRGPGISS